MMDDFLEIGDPVPAAEDVRKDVMRFVGNLAFAKRFRLAMDDDKLPGSSESFAIKWHDTIISFDVKTVTDSKYLEIGDQALVHSADVLVLAKYSKGEVSFVGWTTRGAMISCGEKILDYGKLTYRRKRKELSSMITIDDMMNEPGAGVCQVFNEPLEWR